MRIILKDDGGKLYRVIKVGLGYSDNGGYFVKLIVPYMNTSFMHDINDSGDITEDMSKYTSQFQPVNEYSYHYEVGVAHWKDRTNKVNQKRGLPKITDDKPILLGKLFLNNLSPVGEFKKKCDPQDIVLTTEFDPSKLRILEFHLCRPDNMTSLSIVDEHVVSRSEYILETPDPNIRIIVGDFTNSLKPSKDGISLFVPDDPGENYEKVTEETP